jgi:hypothetical protein
MSINGEWHRRNANNGDNQWRNQCQSAIGQRNYAAAYRWRICSESYACSAIENGGESLAICENRKIMKLINENQWRNAIWWRLGGGNQSMAWRNIYKRRREMKTSAAGCKHQ